MGDNSTLALIVFAIMLNLIKIVNFYYLLLLFIDMIWHTESLGITELPLPYPFKNPAIIHP